MPPKERGVRGEPRGGGDRGGRGGRGAGARGGVRGGGRGRGGRGGRVEGGPSSSPHVPPEPPTAAPRSQFPALPSIHQPGDPPPQQTSPAASSPHGRVVPLPLDSPPLALKSYTEADDIVVIASCHATRSDSRAGSSAPSWVWERWSACQSLRKPFSAFQHPRFQ